MKGSFKVLSLSFFLLLPISAALSQQKSVATSEQELKRQRQRLQAISMVKQSAAEAMLWENKNAAVYVLADAADLLWDENPGQGEKWLRKAWELTDQVSGSPKDEKLKQFFTRSDQTGLRTIVLNVARKHAAQLADNLLKQLAQKQPDEKKDRGAFDDRSARSEQLLQMAQQAVETSPDVAFTLAEQSLADGVSFTLQNVLTSLRKKNVELANRLFDLALACFNGRDPDPSEGQVLAGYLFQSGFTFSTNSSGQTILVMNPAQRNLPSVAAGEPQRAKNFLVAVYEKLLSRPVALDSLEGKQRGQQILLLGNRLAGSYRTFAPELVPSAQGFLAQLRRQLSPDSETGNAGETTRTTSVGSDTSKPPTKEELYEKRIAELEERADKESNASFKRVAYLKAATATQPEDYGRAKRIAEKIDDDDLRADAVSFMLYRAALFFIEKTDIEKASEIAPQISDVSRRSVVKIAIAQRLLASKAEKTEPGVLGVSQQRAFDLLTEAERDLRKAEPSANVARILLGRTALLARLDRVQALASLEQVVQIINRLAKFDLRDGAAPDLNLALAETPGVSRPRIGFSFRNAIELLIDTDFEQVAAVAERLTVKELNGVGRLEVAKLFLKTTESISRASDGVLK